MAQAVIDASGTIERPGWLGASGVAALGEQAAADHIFYGIPDVLGASRARYAGKRVVVVGSGHSAMNALIDLAQLAEDEPATHITWAIRRSIPGERLGGARQDQLENRGRLGSNVHHLLKSGRITLVTDFRVERITRTTAGVVVTSDDRSLAATDEIIAATGFRRIGRSCRKSVSISTRPSRVHACLHRSSIRMSTAAEPCDRTARKN